MRLLRIHCQLSPEPTAIPTQAALHSSQNCIKKLDTNKQQFKQSQSPECSLCVWVSSMCLCGWGGTQYKWDNNYIAANTYIATAAGFLCFVLPYLKKHWGSFAFVLPAGRSTVLPSTRPYNEIHSQMSKQAHTEMQQIVTVHPGEPSCR